MIVVNLFAGPSRGKSVLAADVFSALKKRNVNCELINEYAKSRVWEESYKTLDDQVYVFAKQSHRQFTCKDKVDVIITDSPILLSIVYDKSRSESLKQLVIDVFRSYHNLNYLLDYSFGYQTVGRIQDEETANNIHEEIRELLDNTVGMYYVLKEPDPDLIVNKVLELIDDGI